LEEGYQMTGPEHYKEAEFLLNRASDEARKGTPPCAMRMTFKAASVHATLALAAATAEARAYAGDAHPDWLPLLSNEAHQPER
jgi:hypothetical protein